MCASAHHPGLSTVAVSFVVRSRAWVPAVVATPFRELQCRYRRPSAAGSRCPVVGGTGALPCHLWRQLTTNVYSRSFASPRHGGSVVGPLFDLAEHVGD